MKDSKYLYRKKNCSFVNVSVVNGVCSKITLTNVIAKELAKLDKDQLRYYIKEKVNEQKNIDDLSKVKSFDALARAKIVEVTLNENRFWSLFTPWKFAYSYKGNGGYCSVFYIKL